MIMSVTEKSELLERIDAALESVRPHLKVDGGNVEVVGVTEDMKAEIKWLGNCESCNMSTTSGMITGTPSQFDTLSNGILENVQMSLSGCLVTSAVIPGTPLFS